MAALLLAVLLPAAGRAQHFEWVKGFSGTENTFIDCSVADRLGNLYVACHFKGPLEWEGQSLVGNEEHPFSTPYQSFLLAKITPDGEMAWKKMVKTNMGANHPLEMKLVGDTAITCLLHMTPARIDDYYLDFLDTLIYTAEDNPYDFEDTCMIIDCNALLTFDLDGNLIEKHFLAMSFVDSADNDVTWVHPNWGIEYIRMHGIFHGAFDMDEDGNIYMVRDDDDYGYLFMDSSISAVKFWVDGRHVGTAETQKDRLLYIPQILKFSPHLDTLLGTRHIYQYRTTFDATIPFSYLRLDQYGHIYVIAKLDDFFDHTYRVIIDSTQDMYFDFTEKILDMYFLTIFDTALNPLGFVTIDDSDSSVAGGQDMYDISFDYDSNLFFISGDCCQNMCYRNTPINPTTTRDDAYILSFELNTFPPVLHSASKSPSKESFISPEPMSHGNLITKDGRAYIQMKYKSPVYTPTQQFAPPTHEGWSAGLVTFDYNGNVERIIDYNIWSPQMISGLYQTGMVLHDSTLYLTNELQQLSVTFGDIPYSAGRDHAVIAKYVDPAFMEPLVARPNTGIAPQPLPADGRLEVGPNPTSGLLYMALPSYEVAERVDIYSADGHLLGSTRYTTIDFGPLPDGIYMLRVLTNRNTYTARVVKVNN